MEAGLNKLVRIGQLELRFLVDEIQSSGSLVMFEFVIPPHARVPAPHYHLQVDEALYALEGTTTSTVDGRKHALRKGESLLVARGAVHTHENLHAEVARSLVVLTPGSIGRGYFEEIAALVNAPGKPDAERVKQVMLRHGLVAD